MGKIFLPKVKNFFTFCLPISLNLGQWVKTDKKFFTQGKHFLPASRVLVKKTSTRKGYRPFYSGRVEQQNIFSKNLENFGLRGGIDVQVDALDTYGDIQHFRSVLSSFNAKSNMSHQLESRNPKVPFLAKMNLGVHEG